MRLYWCYRLRRLIRFCFSYRIMIIMYYASLCCCFAIYLSQLCNFRSTSSLLHSYSAPCCNWYPTTMHIFCNYHVIALHLHCSCSVISICPEHVLKIIFSFYAIIAWLLSDCCKCLCNSSARVKKYLLQILCNYFTTTMELPPQLSISWSATINLVIMQHAIKHPFHLFW